jgi:hypothetical protein
LVGMPVLAGANSDEIVGISLATVLPDMHDPGSPIFGASKPRERGSTPVSLLRGRRGADADALISFNLLPQETEDDVVPGRVSHTRLMLVHYWRRDRQAEAEAAAAFDALPPREELIPATEMYVNGSPVAPKSLPPADAGEPSPQKARPDLLAALKSSSSHIPLPASGLATNGPARDTPPPSSSLFVEPAQQETAPVKKAPSIFERRPREIADEPPPSRTESLFVKTPPPSGPASSHRTSGLSAQDRLGDIVRRTLVDEPDVDPAQKDEESVWAKFRESVEAVSRGEPHQFDPTMLLQEARAEASAAVQAPEAPAASRPSAVRALETFLRQIESQSVA